MIKNNLILNKIFTKNNIIKLIENEANIELKKSIQKYMPNHQITCLTDAYSTIFNYMNNSYKNEYIYKNILFNKFILGIHNLNTASALAEIPISNSKADFILLNKNPILFEIKTDLDSFERLDSQLKDYYQAFPKVCILTSETMFKKLKNHYKNLGIYILSNKNTIQRKVEPIADYSNLCYETIFKILRKKEYENILLDTFGFLPDVKPVKYYKACLALFKTINKMEAYEKMIDELKKRNKILDINNFNNKIPYELKSLVYFSNVRPSEYEIIQKNLIKKYRR